MGGWGRENLGSGNSGKSFPQNFLRKFWGPKNARREAKNGDLANSRSEFSDLEILEFARPACLPSFGQEILGKIFQKILENFS